MEILDIVDKSDEIIGKASYEDIYNKLLTHRIVHVLIFDKKKLLLQYRSEKKHFYPLSWSTSVGGHVRSGETYEQAALRECEEELSIRPKLNFFSKDLYIDNQEIKGIKKWLTTFKVMSSGPFSLNKKEVEKVEFLSLSEIQKMINKGEKFHPELLFLLNKYFF